jgi:hypothetical protein
MVRICTDCGHRDDEGAERECVTCDGSAWMEIDVGRELELAAHQDADSVGTKSAPRG